MRILFLNASDLKGGAAQVAWTVAQAMRQRGHEAEYWVERKTSDHDFVREFKDSRNGKRTLAGRAIHRLGIDALNLESDLPKHSGLGAPSSFDVIHLHDLSRLNWSHLRWLSRQAPLVWTVHSMAPFTGNCVYSFGCERYRAGCGACPQHGHWPLLWHHRDGSRLNLALKRWLLRRTRIQLVGVSNWITGRCRESRLFRKMPATTIPNAVDPRRFHPVDKDEARSRLGVPRDASVVLLSVAGDGRDTRKGLDLAISALKSLKDVPLFLLPLGISGEAGDLAGALSEFAGLPPRHVDHDALLRDYYAAADVVWHPSRADTSSMVSLEAFACGTPVIAAAVGGVPEVVDESCGLRIPAGDSGALASATRRFFTEPGLREHLTSACLKRDAVAEFRRLGDDYEHLFGRVAKSPAAHHPASNDL